jgi:tetratricopeptide (TPR) repeat protein
MDGHSLFLACEFKEAARTFERGLADQPESAFLYYWAGKSYARLAEVSSSFSAPKNAHKARQNLERAVQLDPDNQKYLQELFEFYLESPGWFRGGLNRGAALQERVRQQQFANEHWKEKLAAARDEYGGPAWWETEAILCTYGAVGSVIPSR